ncbi:MAG TPA: tRNA uridine-5-carboxymethylaminomethyl(34) synthesis enzyme MnmG, partial [Erythrobacter sp.]|nr:tRNA uridine-5-carboxymethylaminomethyl(34) synthesis enzyme MnmG [Erythrobacter sp.]
RRADWYRQREQRRAEYEEKFGTQIHSRDLVEAGFHVKQDAGPRSASEWLAAGHIDLGEAARWIAVDPVDPLAVEMAEDAFYAPYLARQQAELSDLRKSETQVLAPDFPFASVPGLSNEMVERLSLAKPETLAAAGRIRGITPAALAALLVHARKLDRAA